MLGEIKSFNNKRSVTAASIKPLTDHNEYLYHQLEVIYVHLQLSKTEVRAAFCGAMLTLQPKAESNGAFNASAYDNSSLQATDSNAADLSRLSALQRKIYQAIAAEAPDWPEGVDVRQIAQRCKGSDAAEVQCVGSDSSSTDHRDAIDELANDGYIYQASDETHYLTTAG